MVLAESVVGSPCVKPRFEDRDQHTLLGQGRESVEVVKGIVNCEWKVG